MKPKNGMRPIHPGEILAEEFLKPLNMSAREFAEAIGVPNNRVSAIVAGVRNVTADTALRFGRALDTTAEFWLNLQQTHDLRVAEQQTKLERVHQVHRVGAAAAQRSGTSRTSRPHERPTHGHKMSAGLVQRANAKKR